MVPQVIVPNALEALPARPPTPPREKNINSDLTSRKKHILGSQSLHTPPSFSPDSSDLSNPTSRRNRKKVGFTSQPEYCEAPAYVDHVKLQHPTPVSTSSTTSAQSSSRPIKSILKPSPVVVNPLDPSVGLDGSSRPLDIVKMLESTVQQLAGADRDMKVDAYMMLVRVLKNSNNLPDRIALQDKMSLFMQFIQRDITAKTSEGSLDSSLVNHALLLLSTFMFYPAIASTLSNDFGVFIIDHCIRSFEDASAPKDVTRHLMQVVAYQDFSPKVMTADRVGRLVASLHTIEDRVQGKSIIQSRLFIYRRLIKQSKMHMINHSDWLLDLFEDMLSSIKEIRASAIALGLEASFTIAKEKQFSRRVMEILQMSVEETKYIELYVSRLRAMLKEKSDSTAVPQIWSVVILLMRCPVDRWEFFGPWLEIIQSCFNSSDFQTKLEANYAWNRLVYALQLNDQSFAKTITTICQPFLSQLKRRSTGKQSAELRKVVFGSICNLYYYAFKPNTSTAQLDAFWDACVRPLFQRMIVPEADTKSAEKPVGPLHDHTAQATVILTGLLDSTTPRIWKEDHVWVDPLVKPEDLPSLDAKWVRHNASRVFGIVEQILSRTYLDLAKPDSATAKLWRALVGAVASAASKEVKVSTDTATFLAHTFTFLLKVWSRGIEEAEDTESKSTTFFEATSFYIGTIIDALGLLPFTERQLSMGNQNTFVPVATPSHRPAKGQAQTRTPLHHLFSIFSTLPPNTVDGQDLAILIQRVLAPFLSVMSNKSPRAKIDLAQELMQLIPMETLIPFGPWLAISDTLSNCLTSQVSQSSTSSNGQPTIGHEYREIVKHLERGIKSTPNLPWEHWQFLFQNLFVRVAAEVGEAGCAISIIEPLAKCAMEAMAVQHDNTFSPTVLKIGSELVSNAKHPRDRQALEAARRRLWGTSAGGPRSASYDPFDNLYKLMNHLLEVTYKHYDDSISMSICSLLEDISGFLLRCNQESAMKALVIVQNGLGSWIRDADELYNSRQSTTLSEAVKQLWGRVCHIFAQADSLEGLQLNTVEPLLCSAFESKHKHIVSTATIMWNSVFEQVDSTQYPDMLKAVLLALRPYVDIVLPGLDDLSNEASGQPPSFIDSQEDDSAALKPPPRSSLKGTPQMSRSISRRSTPGSVQLSLPAKRNPNSTPEVSRPRSTRKSTTPLLRHNDSQIQFAAIASSSPTHNNTESQVLTDRQREVRDRQRDNAALFPEIKSSVEQRRSTRLSLANSTIPITTPEKNSTPKSHRMIEDYTSLTPTPRRGQAAIIYNDQEMTDDVPSSPPEPRRYPLLPELSKTQSSSSIVLDDWPPSSPISESPSRNRQSAPHLSESAAPAPPETSNDVSVDAELLESTAADDDVEMDEAVGEDKADEADVEDETNILVAEEDLVKAGPSLPAAVEGVASKDPDTPTNARFPKEQGTPRSDTDVYVDALSSPNRSPRNTRSQAKTKQQTTKAASQPAADCSFDASDVDERSMLRLVVELDSRKCDGSSKDSLELSEKTGKKKSPVKDCITVSGGQKRRRSARNKGRTEETSPVIASTPAEPDSSQASATKTQNKRKRAQEENSQSQDSGSKKRKHRKEDVNSDKEAAVSVPDPQLLPANDDNTSLEPSEISGREQHSGSSRASSDRDHEEMEMDAEISSPAADTSADESEAIHLQIVQEASQSESAETTVNDSFERTEATEADHVDVPMSDLEEEEEGELEEEEEAEDEDEEDDQDEIPATTEPSDVMAAAAIEEDPPYMIPSEELAQSQEAAMPPATSAEKTSMEKIMSALRGGLVELGTAALSRDEVSKIEDMLYDMKRELYNAESRGRTLSSQPR